LLVALKKNSVKFRFIVTLITNILRIGLAFSSGVIIARSLGPAQYGNYNFLLGSFTALIVLIDMASSKAFYTILSKEKQGTSFFLHYVIWLMIQLLILVTIVLLLPETIKNKIWVGHSDSLIMLALIASFSMIKIWQFSTQIGESIRDTLRVQARNFILAAIYLISVLLLALYNVMDIKGLFVLNAILYFLFSILYAVRVLKIGEFSTVKRKDFTSVFNEFNKFCYPLIPYTIIGFLYTFADYWLLQQYGGSIQQGYYAIGSRFSALVLIATTSILQIFWKEISEAHSNNNIERVRLLYSSISKSFFWGSMVISSFVIPHSRQIIDLFLGSSYRDAWLPLSLMFFYPVHQSMGQITGTMLFAMGKTKTASYIGIFFMLLSILFAYIILAPKTAIVPGFQMGATGLAIKMLACQIMGVNISAFFVAKYIHISFDWIHQIQVLCLLPISIFSKLFSNYLLALTSIQKYTILVMTVSGFFYLMIVIVLVYCFPSIAGMKRKHINHGIFWIRARINTLK